MTTVSVAASSALWIVAGAMIFAGIKDVVSMKISNRLVLSLFAAYGFFALLTGLDMYLIAYSSLVAVGVLAGTFVLFALGWIGGGDAKLAAVIALWLGPDLTVPFLFYTAMTGGAFALALLVFRSMPLPAFLLKPNWSANLHMSGAGLPYGIPMAAASLLLLPQTQWASLI
jgi:prepilin peptidase CpaA